MPAGSYMAAIEQRGYLMAGVDQNTLLWAYRDQAGELAGFDIDMVDQVAAAIFGATWSHHIRYVIVPNADRASAVYNGDVDIVAETMTITCGRQGFGSGAIATPVDFSTEYYDAGQAVLVAERVVRSGQRRIWPARPCAPRRDRPRSTTWPRCQRRPS